MRGAAKAWSRMRGVSELFGSRDECCCLRVGRARLQYAARLGCAAFQSAKKRAPFARLGLRKATHTSLSRLNSLFKILVCLDTLRLFFARQKNRRRPVAYIYRTVTRVARTSIASAAACSERRTAKRSVRLNSSTSHDDAQAPRRRRAALRRRSSGRKTLNNAAQQEQKPQPRPAPAEPQPRP